MQYIDTNGRGMYRLYLALARLDSLVVSVEDAARRVEVGVERDYHGLLAFVSFHCHLRLHEGDHGAVVERHFSCEVAVKATKGGAAIEIALKHEFLVINASRLLYDGIDRRFDERKATQAAALRLELDERGEEIVYRPGLLFRGGAVDTIDALASLVRDIFGRFDDLIGLDVDAGDCCAIEDAEVVKRMTLQTRRVA
jgi:hypothetical protein